MHTMYVDKPMQGHGLMQAIARVNRVFRDKPAGLVVDYIGVAQNLKSALGQYSKLDHAQTGINEAEAVAVMLEKYEIVRDMFRPDTKGGFDYRRALAADATSPERLGVNVAAIAMASVFPSATGSSQASNSRLYSGANVRKPNSTRKALSCSRRVCTRTA
jgi:type I restriction enzyme R subunit